LTATLTAAESKYIDMERQRQRDMKREKDRESDVEVCR